MVCYLDNVILPYFRWVHAENGSMLKKDCLTLSQVSDDAFKGHEVDEVQIWMEENKILTVFSQHL